VPGEAGYAVLPGYIAGDEIVIDTFSFRHEMNVEQVYAYFVHEEGEHEIQLIGNPEQEAADQGIATASGPRRIKRLV
jgi:hypothetical protein